MRKIILTATTIAALAVPAVSMAAPLSAGFATAGNPSSADQAGFCVAAGNVNYHYAGTGTDHFGTTSPSTGTDRSSYAGQPGAVAALMAEAQANGCGQSTYSGPS